MRRVVVSLLALALCVGSLASRASAQAAQRPRAITVRTVEGRVVKPVGAENEAPVAGEWVTLHRVAEDSAAPLDSMQTDARGRYAFRYRPFGSSDAIYFVSARYGGIAYFAPPLTAAVVRGEDADIAVYDTTSAAPPTIVRGRHLIVSAEDSTGRRTVIEVYEISNDTTLTFVASAGSTSGTFSAALPAGARDFQVGQGDVAPDAIEVRDGRAYVVAPFAPGLKQLSFSYSLAPDDFPLAVALERPTAVLEVLVEDAGSNVTGSRLLAVDPVTVDGRSFRRFLAQDARARDSLFVAVAGGTVRANRYVPGLLLALGSALLVGLGLAVRRRGVDAPTTAGDPSLAGERERLARDISELDARFASEPDPSPVARAEYEARRDSLKRALARLLAGPPRAH